MDVGHKVQPQREEQPEKGVHDRLSIVRWLPWLPSADRAGCEYYQTDGMSRYFTLAKYSA
jgi:hypothetical protein